MLFPSRTQFRRSFDPAYTDFCTQLGLAGLKWRLGYRTRLVWLSLSASRLLKVIDVDFIVR